MARTGPVQNGEKGNTTPKDPSIARLSNEFLSKNLLGVKLTHVSIILNSAFVSSAFILEKTGFVIFISENGNGFVGFTSSQTAVFL